MMAEDEKWSESEPDSMRAIASALQLEEVAPQLAAPAATDMADVPQELPPIFSEEISALEALEESPYDLSTLERELLERSLESLDYLGDWACQESPPKDSAVLCCIAPEVHQGESGPEYTCAYDDFTAERQQLHTHIVERMLTSARTTGGNRAVRSAWLPLELREEEESVSSSASTSQQTLPPNVAAAIACGPPAMRTAPPLPTQQHVFFVVGVPGSGKDTVLKRYLRSLGLPLIDASADLVKEYLAAWGQDDLSTLVRDNNAVHGPGKHLLHAQYLHRESILVTDMVVER